MRRTATLLIVLLLSAGALVPMAAAGWKYRGMNEPDTDHDVLDGYMWPTADTTVGPSKVYFNGFMHVALTWLNPNVAAVGSKHQPGVEADASAILGFWKDCNKDGYIGNSELGLFEYRAELVGTDVCPRVPVSGNCDAGGANPRCPDPYPHNDGGWVRELIWIGIRENGANPTVYVPAGSSVANPAAKVWFDWGLPGAVPGVTCPTTGSFSIKSTGAFVEWADCFTRYNGIRTLNFVQDTTSLPVGGWDPSDVESSDNTLNVRNPAYTLLNGENGEGGLYGRDHDDQGHRPDRVVTVWDCSDNENPTVDTAPEVHPDGSAYEVANETYNIATSTNANNPNGRCKHTAGNSNNALPWFDMDGDTESTNAAAGKDFVSDYLIWTPGSRVVGKSSALGPHPPPDMGLTIERDADTIGSSWKGNRIWGLDPQVINRGTLEPQGAIYLTFYAWLAGDPLFVLPGGATSLYGSPPCTSTTGIQGGWKCDPAAWAQRCVANGVTNADGTASAACIKVGQAYQLRDVDCWDGDVARGVGDLTGVFASGAVIGLAANCADDNVPGA